MSKRPSLFGKPAAQATPLTPDDSSPAPAVPRPQPVAAPAQPIGRKHPVASTRQGKRVATVYLEPEAWKQLQVIALEEETTIQALLSEGVNHVFEKRGKSRIA